MAEQKAKVVSGTIVEEEGDVTLYELCEACAVRAETVEAMIEEGIVTPSGNVEHSQRIFSRSTVIRVGTVVRMQRELRVNLAGAALALDLLERIKELNARLRSVDPEGGHQR